MGRSSRRKREEREYQELLSRRIPIQCNDLNLSLEEEEQLMQKLRKELPAFTAQLLAIPIEEIEETLR